MDADHGGYCQRLYTSNLSGQSSRGCQEQGPDEGTVPERYTGVALSHTRIRALVNSITGLHTYTCTQRDCI